MGHPSGGGYNEPSIPRKAAICWDGLGPQPREDDQQGKPRKGPVTYSKKRKNEERSKKKKKKLMHSG